MASNSSSNSVFCCPNCNENCDEVCMFPCLHEFCLQCTNKMTNGAEITCLACSKKCHQDDIKKKYVQRQMFFFQEEDSNIIDHKKEEIMLCKRHKQYFSIYCKICKVLICHTCCIMEHLDHSKPENLEDNLEKVFAESTSDIKRKISQMDDIIRNQNNLIQENKNLQTNFLKNYDKVRTAIENYASELKDKIDVIKNAMILQIDSIENQLLKSIKNNIYEIKYYIDSLNAKKSYYTYVINEESKINIFNLKSRLNQNNWIEDKSEKDIKAIKVTFKKPSLEKLISSELSKSFKVDSREDLKILSLKNNTCSTCIFDEKFYTVYHEDNIITINIYDKETLTYNTSINLKPNVLNNITSTYIVNTQNNLFIYYRLESNEYTYILRLLKDENITFIKLKTLKDVCLISSTYHQTLLVRSTSRQLIELSENGDELKRIETPDAAEIPSPSYFDYSHQLKDGRYVVTSFNNKSVLLSILDNKGTFINSFTQESTADITTCTDGEKYIFVLEWNVGKITVLSTHLQYMHQFYYPEVRDIYYDKVNDKILLEKQNEIIYFTYYLGKLF